MAQASSCVTGWYNNLDKCEADGCKLRSLYPRMIWDLILENAGLLCMRGQANLLRTIIPFFLMNPCMVSYLVDDNEQVLCPCLYFLSLLLSERWQLINKSQSDTVMRTAIDRILNKCYWKICFGDVNYFSRCS